MNGDAGVTEPPLLRWLIAATDALSIPGAVVLGWFAFLYRSECGSPCRYRAAGALIDLAIVLLVLSLGSLLCLCVRSPGRGALLWLTTLVGWVVVLILLFAD